MKLTIKDIKERGLLLFECISGSKSYGLDTPQSDTDLKGVFYLPKEEFYGMEYTAQINNESNDEVYYELGRFVELLCKNNPNMLEMLATPDDCVLYKHPLMDKIPLSIFLSKLCRDSFAGYAYSQIKKARGYKKKIVNPVEKERKGVLDFCYILEGYSSVPLKEWLAKNNYTQEKCGLISIDHTKGAYALFYDNDKILGYKGIIQKESANEVALSSVPKGEKELAYLFFNIESYSLYCKEYKEYWEWISKRNEARYQNNMEHGKNYDSKNMMHTIRLLEMAEEIFRDGELNVRRKNREELLHIKAGKMEYDDLMAKADNLIKNIDKYFINSKLQDKPDIQKVTEILIDIRNELYG